MSEMNREQALMTALQKARNWKPSRPFSNPGEALAEFGAELIMEATAEERARANTELAELRLLRHRIGTLYHYECDHDIGLDVRCTECERELSAEFPEVKNAAK